MGPARRGTLELRVVSAASLPLKGAWQVVGKSVLQSNKVRHAAYSVSCQCYFVLLGKVRRTGTPNSASICIPTRSLKDIAHTQYSIESVS